MKMGIKHIGLFAVGGVLGYFAYRYFNSSKTPKLKKSSTAISDKEVEGLLDTWKKEICNPKKTPDSIANLYGDNALLHGTLASDLAEGKDAVKDYFVGLLENDNLCVEIDNNTVQKNDTTVSNSGVYTFSLETDGRPKKINARYSFIYGKDKDGKWKIINHHSSRRKPLPKQKDKV